MTGEQQRVDMTRVFEVQTENVGPPLELHSYTLSRTPVSTVLNSHDTYTLRGDQFRRHRRKAANREQKFCDYCTCD